jgi:hypothetical protein
MNFDDEHKERVARIDENVKHLIRILPVIQKLDRESEINKHEHKWAISIFAATVFPFLIWLVKRIGIQIP